MNRSTLHVVLRQAGGLVPGPDAEPDADLLRRFAATRDEPAFGALLRRHGPMVWAVCRHLLPDPADAEDAFQATFLALVRSAGSIRRGAAVGGWLHGVAVRAATRVKRAAARRRHREHRAAGNEADRSVPEGTWETLLAAVHEEVRRLPDPLRAAFVLCDLEGVRQPDAATRLGWKPGTLTGRLARARQLLLDRLASRGLAPLVAGGTVGLGVATAAGAVPAGLAGKVMQSIGAGGTVPPALLKLAREVMPMTLTRVKLAAVGLLAAGGLTAGLGTTFFPPAKAQPPEVVDEARLLLDALAGQTEGGGPPKPGEPAPPAKGGGGDATGGALLRDGMKPVPLSAKGGGGDATGGAAGQGWGVAVAAGRAEWEYTLVDKPDTLREFKTLLADHGKEGWEYCDVAHLSRENPAAGGSRQSPPQRQMMVFKRPKARAAAAGGFGGGGGGFGGVGLPGFSGQMQGVPPGGGVGQGPGMGLPPGFPGGGGGAFGPGRAGGAEEKAATAELKTFALHHLNAQAAARVIAEIFPQNARVSFDARTNTLVVTAHPPVMAGIEKVIAILDRPNAAAESGGGATTSSGGAGVRTWETPGVRTWETPAPPKTGTASGGSDRIEAEFVRPPVPAGPGSGPAGPGSPGGPRGTPDSPTRRGGGGPGGVTPPAGGLPPGGMGMGAGGGGRMGGGGVTGGGGGVAVAADAGARPHPVTVVRLKYAKAPDIAVTLSQVFQAEGLKVTTDERTNSLILRGDEKTISDVKVLVKELDVEEAPGTVGRA